MAGCIDGELVRDRWRRHRHGWLAADAGSYNSLVGMLATRFGEPRGYRSAFPDQDRAGPLGRSVYDVAVMIDAMAGFDPEDLDTREGWALSASDAAGQLTCLISGNFALACCAKR